MGSGPLRLSPPRPGRRGGGSVALYPAVAAVSDQPIFAVALDGTVVLWNQAIERLVGIPAREALGKRCYQVIGSCAGPERPLCGAKCATLQAARLGRSASSFDLCLLARSGHPTHLRVNTILLRQPWAVLHLVEPMPMLPLARRDSLDEEDLESADEAFDHLTPREREVLHWLCLGATTSEIAEQLSISRITARNHVQHVLSKLGKHSRLEAVTRALSERLVYQGP